VPDRFRLSGLFKQGLYIAKQTTRQLPPPISLGISGPALAKRSGGSLMLVDLLKLRRPFIFTLRFEGYASDERPFDYYRAVDSLLANLLSRGHSAPLA
jgi:hypothetical protein